MQTVQIESGKTPLYIQCDVTKLPDLEKFVSQSLRHFGGIDIVASNAGANVFKGAENCSYEDWHLNMNLNLESHWNLARLCKPHLENSGEGVIIINSSCHAYNTLPGCFPYNIAKAGIKALVQSLTLEWSPAIRILAVAPGFMDTQLTETYFNSFPDPQKEKEKTLNQFPLKRLGTPEQIGGWFVFLSSHYAAFAGGQTFLIDGGRSSLMLDV
jgi:NAD(P)-dependent dehydrogenase (short-subunit alcohol dehydrogenase family)